MGAVSIPTMCGEDFRNCHFTVVEMGRSVSCLGDDHKTWAPKHRYNNYDTGFLIISHANYLIHLIFPLETQDVLIDGTEESQ